MNQNLEPPKTITGTFNGYQKSLTFAVTAILCIGYIVLFSYIYLRVGEAKPVASIPTTDIPHQTVAVEGFDMGGTEVEIYQMTDTPTRGKIFVESMEAHLNDYEPRTIKIGPLPSEWISPDEEIVSEGITVTWLDKSAGIESGVTTIDIKKDDGQWYVEYHLLPIVFATGVFSGNMKVVSFPGVQLTYLKK
jgi:hypothetical protein